MNYSTVRSNFKEYLDHVNETAETIIVTRKNNKNAVIMSLNEYNSLMDEQKRLKNEAYLMAIDASIKQIEDGKIVIKTIEELEK
ncbi:MAG: type II toxin-antitoxin system Phd/YefM family antitoxin [Methanimicrococcus sp.]|nr:type II toxin-antitoxin system Phd/YefM family antitoxin [Methanimicrococcus sp.]